MSSNYNFMIHDDDVSHETTFRSVRRCFNKPITQHSFQSLLLKNT